MNNTKIGQFISEKRKALGLTQQELAEKLQITNKAVSKWETGDGMPDVQLLSPLANELGITVDEILNGEEKIVEEKTSPLVKPYVYDLPVGVVVTCMLAVFFALRNLLACISSGVQNLFLFGDTIIDRLPYTLISLGFGVYWVLLSIIFVCRFLKLFEFKFKIEKTLTIVVFVAGFIMLFAQQIGNSPIRYGMFMFSFALLLGTFHGYRVPHKIFYGLTMLITIVYGVAQIVTVFEHWSSQGVVSQVYGTVYQFIVTIIFYIFYGLLEKFSSEYEGIEE